jgi:hypothetical protein
VWYRDNSSSRRTSKRNLPHQIGIASFAIFGLVAYRAANTAQSEAFSCLMPIGIVPGKADTGRLHGPIEIPGIGAFVDTDKGRFLAAQTANGRVELTRWPDDVPRPENAWELSSGGFLVQSSQGRWLFMVVRRGNGPKIQNVDNPDMGYWNGTFKLPGGGVLIYAEKGFFYANKIDERVTFKKVGDDSIGRISGYLERPNGNLFIGGENGGLLVVQTPDSGVTLERWGTELGAVRGVHEIHGGDVLISAHNGLLDAVQAENGKMTFTPVHVNNAGEIYQGYQFPSGEVLLHAERGLFLAAGAASGHVTVQPIRDASALVKPGKSVIPGLVSLPEFHELPGVGVLIRNQKKWFLLSEEANSDVTITAVTAEIGIVGSVSGIFELPGGDVLVQIDNKLLLASRAKSGHFSLEAVWGAETGAVLQTVEMQGVGVLIRAKKGLFFASQTSGAGSVIKPIVESQDDQLSLLDLPSGGLIHTQGKWLVATRAQEGTVGLQPIGGLDSVVDLNNYNVRKMFELRGGDLLITTDDAIFELVRDPLTSAIVNLQNRTTLDNSSLDTKVERDFDFTVEHACAPVLGLLGAQIDVTSPGGVAKAVDSANIVVQNKGGSSKITARLLVDRPGTWSFKLSSVQGGSKQEIGIGAQQISFTKVIDARSVVEAIAWWAGMCLGTVFLIANAAFFVAARRSAKAWRVATDDSLITAPLRLATYCLSHVPMAQVWILDLYFQRRKATLVAQTAFLPLPLKCGDAAPENSDAVVAPPWTEKRIWIQGGSGMGKTALYRYITTAHFRESTSAIEAYEKWGCIVAAFSARDYAGGGEDTPDPSWVIDAVRATLSERGLKIENDALLRRLLESGTIAVAIDGLHEAARTKSVEAFVRAFEATPMLVTSQESGGEQFTTWRLPPDMQAFIDDLLRKYLGDAAATSVIERITSSGLRNAIRSGYDVRVVSDLVRTDPAHSPLPSDRIGLYAAVVRAGWPTTSKEAMTEEQERTSAAAWRMVSERKPNEDKRRLKPDVDLDKRLLDALADAPERDKRPVRLVRRVGDSYEFVHDQMHAFLAARWFAQVGFTIAELKKMVAGSTIWTDTRSAREILWTFAAALLDNERLIPLWELVDNEEEWNTLRLALKREAERRGLRRS